MALPNGAGGYQLGDGNVNDPFIDLTADPVAVTATATLTPAQVLNGLILANNGVTAAAQTTSARLPLPRSSPRAPVGLSRVR
jgi:hypothetical protein